MRFCCVVLGFMALSFSPPLPGQINDHDIIVSEFFDDILRVRPGAVDDLFDIQRSDNITHLTISDPTTAFVNNFLEIWKIDMSSRQVSTLVDLGAGYTAPAEITMGLDGNLIIATATHGIQRVDATTGAVSDIHNETFFNPSDVVATGNGHIYATEFFDGLGHLDTNGNWHKVGDFSANFFNHLDIGPDGYLYASTTFEGGDVYRVHPITGAHEKIVDNVYTFIDDLQVAADGFIYLAGNHDVDDDHLVESTVLRIDPFDGSWESVVDERQVGKPRPPFFNTMDIEIFYAEGGFHLPLPDPNGSRLGDFNRNGTLDDQDIDLLSIEVNDMTNNSSFDLNDDGQVDQNDRIFWIQELKKTWVGDADLDGQFNSRDLVAVFRAGEYDDRMLENSSWSTGDFNGDMEFDSGDLVAAFQDGGYDQGPRTALHPVPEPSNAMLLAIGFATLVKWVRSDWTFFRRSTNSARPI